MPRDELPPPIASDFDVTPLVHRDVQRFIGQCQLVAAILSILALLIALAAGWA